MSYVLLVTTPHGSRSNEELSAFNEMKTVGTLREAAAEAMSIVQKFIRKGINQHDVEVKIFDYGMWKLVAVGRNYDDTYQIEGVLKHDSSHYDMLNIKPTLHSGLERTVIRSIKIDKV